MEKNARIYIDNRAVGKDCSPFVIAEIGINHEGSMDKALKMIDDAKAAGCECVKFQSHIIEDEMIPNDVIPGNANETIWNMMKRCSLNEAEERDLKKYVESLGMIFLCSPFSRAAAERLESMGVAAYKIGSGECNNYPLIEHIASFGKPVILSTGMNEIPAVKKAAEIFKKRKLPFALLHCTSIYPTPYENVRLKAIDEMTRAFPGVPIGLSDHSIRNYTCFGAVARGACILEKHFTSDKNWPGSDIPISITPAELKDLIEGSAAIHAAMYGRKTILKQEQPTINFAYASVVTIRPIRAGEPFTSENTWVKRPGTGDILAVDYPKVLGRTAKHNLQTGIQVSWENLK